MEHRDEPGLIDAARRIDDARRIVVAITLVGAAVRIAMLATKWNQRLLLNDSLWYSVQAHSLAHGRFFPDFFDVSGAEHAPLTSILLAPASLAPHHEFWQRATMTLIGIAFVPLVALVAGKFAGRRVAVVAAAIAAVYPNIWMSDALVMSETISGVMITLTLLVALRYRDRLDVRTALLLGLVVGVAAHARSEVLIFAPLFALIGLRTSRRGEWAKRAAAILAATLVTVTPWVTFNLSRFNEPVLMSTNDGTTLLGANCPLTYGGPALGGWSVVCVLDSVGPQGEDASERSARQRREAISYARANAGRLVVVVPARLLRTLDLYGLGDLVANDVGEERPRWAVWAGVASWWVLAPLAAVALWRHRRRAGLVLAAPLICVFVTSVVFYGSHRLRSPLEPVVVIGAAWLLATSRRGSQWGSSLVARLSRPSAP